MASVPTSRSPIHDVFAEFEAYSMPNWDGDEAEAITPAAIRAARDFYYLLPRELGTPDIAPGSDGTIGFEWREGTPVEFRYVLVEAGPQGTIIARKINENGSVSRFPAIRPKPTAVRHLLAMLFTPGHASE